MFTFDPEKFQQTVINESFETRLTPVPNGEYVGMITKLAYGNPTSEGSVPMNVIFQIDDANVQAQIGRKPTSRLTVWLNFDDAGGLPRDKNQGLGRLRDAVHQNGSEAWAPSMLLGKACRVKVQQNPDKKTGEIYDNVVAVAKL